MPANLTPEYLNAEEQYKKAKTPQEQLQCLEEMLATIPKHKGTEKLQADIKRRISKLRKGEGKKGKTRIFSYHVEKQGAAQIVLVGPPNCGKTRFVNTVTNASFAIGDYPFTTRIMQPAMMPFENIQIQLVDLPAFHPDCYERWAMGLIRNADLALLMTNIGSDDLLDELEDVLGILNQGKISMVTEHEKENLQSGICEIKTLMVANQLDRENAQERLEVLKEFYANRFKILPVSCLTGEGIENLKKTIFESLNIIRIYTRAPGQKIDFKNPFIMEAGKTIEDIAYHIHKDLASNMKYARIWGKGYYDGQAVDRHHPLKDGDIIEIHA